jgi:EmrB/QacA subfamily drug resistance transporter
VERSINDSIAPRQRGGLLAPLIIGCAVLMQTMDSAVVATALPAMARSLHEDPLTLNLVLTTYLLGAAVLLPLGGWAADRWGARDVFMTGMILFAGASLACGASHSLGHLFIARTIQGMASAILLPVGRLVLLKTAPKSELVRAIAMLTIPALLGPVVGAPLGGLIVTTMSWRWVFLINIPIALTGLVLVRKYIPNVREEEPPSLDLVGIGLSGLALAGLVLGLSNLGRSRLPAGVVGALLVGGLLALALYIRHARGRSDPALDLKLLKDPVFGLTTLGGVFARLPLGASAFLLALLLQVGFGMNALSAGAITLTTAVGAFAMRVASEPIIRLFGFRPLMLLNALLTSGSFAACALFTPVTPHVVIVGTLLVHGFLRSLQTTCVNTLGFADLSSRQMSAGSTLTGVCQQLAQSLGVGLAAAAIQTAQFLRHEAAPSILDIRLAFVAVAVISLASFLFFMRLPANAGWMVAGGRPAERASC